MTNASCSGSCLCGGVRFEIRPPYEFFQYCHCSRCRKSTGGAHAATILVAEAQFRWLDGEPLVARFELPGARYFCTGFCTRCGSSLPWRTRNGRFFLVPAGGLDDHPGATVERSIHWRSRAPWYEAVDQMPCFDEGPR